MIWVWAFWTLMLVLLFASAAGLLLLCFIRNGLRKQNDRLIEIADQITALESILSYLRQRENERAERREPENGAAPAGAGLQEGGCFVQINGVTGRQAVHDDADPARVRLAEDVDFQRFTQR